MASDLVLLILTSATSHSAAHHPSARWRSLFDEANRTTANGIRMQPNLTPSFLCAWLVFTSLSQCAGGCPGSVSLCSILKKLIFHFFSLVNRKTHNPPLEETSLQPCLALSWIHLSCCNVGTTPFTALIRGDVGEGLLCLMV